MERSVFSRVIRATVVNLLFWAPPFCLAWMLYAVWWDGLFHTKGIDASLSFLAPYAHAISISGWVIFLSLLVAFPLWLRDVSRRINAQSSLPFSPLRAALAFFIPVQQIGLPYSVARSLCFRLDRKVGRDPLLLAWWGSWLLMLPAGIYYGASSVLHASMMSYSHLVLWVYGSAAVFCTLALLVVLRMERGLTAMGNAAFAYSHPIFESALGKASVSSNTATVPSNTASVPSNTTSIPSNSESSSYVELDDAPVIISLKQSIDHAEKERARA